MRSSLKGSAINVPATRALAPASRDTILPAHVAPIPAILARLASDPRPLRLHHQGLRPPKFLSPWPAGCSMPAIPTMNAVSRPSHVRLLTLCASLALLVLVALSPTL